ncbi:MAG: hypothetical protein K9H61_07595 [Bacteroidia bacterium]|nr:hypothetical protein [Bacteroidia bacterium]MCF8428290.1 hypothetical protein [Bacteroidia bacterium]MCF8446844.1 hypothetical protein [Bacteroidia bacterium]
MGFLLNIISAFLGGGIALFGQWYFLLRERSGNKRNILFYLLEINGNMSRLNRFENFDKIYDIITLKVSESADFGTMPSNDFLKPILKNILYKGLYEDVLIELNELNKKYLLSVDQLSKENPTLAYKIRNHSRSFNNMVNHLENFSSSIKLNLPESEHSEIERTFELVAIKNIINDALKEINDSIVNVSKEISFFEYLRVRKLLKKVNMVEESSEELYESIQPLMDSIINGFQERYQKLNLKNDE